MGERELVVVDCPYCGTEQRVGLKRSVVPQVVLCDIEDVPGCDQYFGVTLYMEPVLEYFTIATTEAASQEKCEHNLPAGCCKVCLVNARKGEP